MTKIEESAKILNRHIEIIEAKDSSCCHIEVINGTVTVEIENEEKEKEARMVGFCYRELDNDKIVPIETDTPDITLFHELDHARYVIRIDDVEGNATGDVEANYLVKYALIIDENNGSLNTPICSLDATRKNDVRHIMGYDPSNEQIPSIEEIQNIGITIDKTTGYEFRDKICEANYRFTKENEDFIRYPYSPWYPVAPTKSIPVSDFLKYPSGFCFKGGVKDKIKVRSVIMNQLSCNIK